MSAVRHTLLRAVGRARPATQDDRARWRLRWLGCLEELGNAEMQRATWLNDACTNPHYGYAEFLYCYLYDRSTDTAFYGYPKIVRSGYLSEAEAKAVATFHRLLEGYQPPNGDENDHRAILDDPRWQEVTSAARDARGELAKIIVDPAEIDALFVPSPYAALAASEGKPVSD